MRFLPMAVGQHAGFIAKKPNDFLVQESDVFAVPAAPVERTNRFGPVIFIDIRDVADVLLQPDDVFIQRLDAIILKKRSNVRVRGRRQPMGEPRVGKGVPENTQQA